MARKKMHRDRTSRSRQERYWVSISREDTAADVPTQPPAPDIEEAAEVDPPPSPTSLVAAAGRVGVRPNTYLAWNDLFEPERAIGAVAVDPNVGATLDVGVAA